MTTSSWGKLKGQDATAKVDYAKMNVGANVFRIVSDVLPRQVYWVDGVGTDGEKRTIPVECLRFNRQTEKFNYNPDPVQEAGLTQKDAKGNIVPLRPRQNYVCWVINRSTGALEILQVKQTMLTAVQKLMDDLEIDDPSYIDVTFDRTGKGRFDTTYSVNAIAALKFLEAVKDPNSAQAKLHASDVDILGEDNVNVKDLTELFPIPTYEEQKTMLDQFLNGSDSDSEAAKEAAKDLDD